MTDEISKLSEALARDPNSLAFVELGEALRLDGRLDDAVRAATEGLERHPNLPDGHDLYARILVDSGDFERARDEWDIALALDPRHVGALKGLAFLRFQEGDLDGALENLETALSVDPGDKTVVQALGTVRAAAASLAEEAQQASREAVFAGLEGARHGILLVDLMGRVLGGGLQNGEGDDVSEEVAAYLAGVSREAERTARVLKLGEWQWIIAEGPGGNIHLTQPTSETLLLLARDRSVPSGRLGLLAGRASRAAIQWLEAQGL